MARDESLLKQALSYFSTHSILLVTSLVTFPILTRVFSVSEYGSLSLLTSLLAMSVSLSKLGMQHSLVRFHPEYVDGRGEDFQAFSSTVFVTPFLFAAAAAVVMFVVAQWCCAEVAAIGLPFLFTLLLIPLQTTSEIYVDLLRAERRVRAYRTITIISRYSSVALGLFLTFFLIGGLKGFFTGILIANACMFVYFAYQLLRRYDISFTGISRPLFVHFLHYGVPLLLYELITTVLDYGDRFLIRYYLNAESLGLYSAGYNAAYYIGNSFITPVRLAIMPIYFKMWTTEGAPATRVFLQGSLRYFLLVAIPVAFGVSAISKELIVTLASSKYYQAYTIIPYVVVGVLVYGSNSICAAGLYLEKKSYILTLSALGSTVLNIVLNLFLIPRYGIIGAAQATLICYLVLIGTNVAASSRYLQIDIPWRRAMLYTGCALVMFLAVSQVNLDSHAASLLAKMATGVAVYSGLVLLGDGELRSTVLTYWRQAPEVSP